MRPSACGDGQKFKHISPHLASPVGQLILTFPKGRNKLLSILPSAPT